MWKWNRLTTTVSVIVAYLALVRLLRFRSRDAARRMIARDPKDANNIHLVMKHLGQDMPALSELGTTFGLLRTYAIPSISKLLVATKQLATKEHVARRYEDTDLILREVAENPPGGEREDLALKRLNSLHGHYNIPNRDYLYVLCVFVLEPIKWVERWGYRKHEEWEKESILREWQRLGALMGIKDIPATLEDAFQFYEAFEEECMVFDPNNRILVDAILDTSLERNVPYPLRPAVRELLIGLCDKRLRTAMGFADPHPMAVWCGQFLMRLHQFSMRYLLLPRLLENRRTPLKPNRDGAYVPRYTVLKPIYKKTGYRIERLGPVSFEDDGKLTDLYPTTEETIAPPGCPISLYMSS